MNRNSLHRPKKEVLFAFTLIGVLVLIIVRRMYSAQNYPKANYPIFSGNFAPEDLEQINDLMVVSYNIRYSQNIVQAIAEIKQFQVQNMYSQAGLERATRSSGQTITKFGVQVTADHIFSKGFEVLGDGKMDEATASDHLPIWARFSWP